MKAIQQGRRASHYW